ncbi:hypothetical protein CALVIDRAFT_532488 [Calocera viscosa TUFC12733]|uniref:Small ribosomal subunit protein mS29 n=1 Tax=Calocera viscosa (strain TUFC12733) TaxID=1330018 RepID=A0A167S9R3_CALVF|nr:hypothetical protein CALVIDRAFT_532488 [Calocera viscosa TUFC12733]
MPSPIDYRNVNENHFDAKPKPLDLLDFEPQNVFTAQIGEPLAYAERARKAFNAFGLPSSNKWSHKVFASPFSVVRDATVQLLTELNVRSEQVRSEPEPTGLILHGTSGCGKSTLLMQALGHCLENGWIVLYIPRSIDVINSSSPYHYEARTKLFNQPVISRALIQGLLEVNREALEKIKVDQDIVYGHQGQTFKAGGELSRLVVIGLEDDMDTVVILDAVMDQLGRQTEFPVLIAVDDYQCLYVESVYRDPQFFPIRAYHLSVPRMVLEFAIGQRQLSRGLVLGALGPLHTNHIAPVPLREAIGAELSWKDAAAGPYAERHKAHVHFSQGLKGFPVPAQVGVEAALGWYKTYVDGLVLHTRASDDFFLAKYTEASGNAREFNRALLDTMQ